ncbi:pseudouridine synthase [Streptococcus phocae subsp. phocae]|uniref:Pseudouridine synthase n=1 Tax=Streptococcus phocae TaxID=119224 RepID=A0A0P6S3N4_9STRE|nr:pseudouridine synthase [Streptococcus phocae]KPJ22722.1 pseudouridine synthase [Streptococcus phocae]
MRLDKFLTAVGLGSRSQVKELLKSKQITVNGHLQTSPKVHIDETKDRVTYQGQVLHYETFVYYMLNKPAGVISATEDPAQKTVLDLLDDTARQKKVFPVGRLDKDTHGLLLLTNNGQLAHDLLSPKKHVPKTYLAKVAGVMTQNDCERFATGIVLKDHTCLPARLEIIDQEIADNHCLAKITLKEGKFHQVKRMVAACGKEVTDLQRISMGPLELDPNLEQGNFRRLTDQEVRQLLKN